MGVNPVGSWYFNEALVMTVMFLTASMALEDLLVFSFTRLELCAVPSERAKQYYDSLPDALPKAYHWSNGAYVPRFKMTVTGSFVGSIVWLFSINYPAALCGLV